MDELNAPHLNGTTSARNATAGVLAVSPSFADMASPKSQDLVIDASEIQKQSEVLAAIRSNIDESQIDAVIKDRLSGLLDELEAHLGIVTFQAKRAALASFAAAHFAVLFPVLGPLIDTLADHP